MNCRYSKQREVVLEVLKNTKIHPTSEQIFEMVKKKDSSISKSTVYRNISILLQKGDILKITMAIGPDRYDFIHEKHHHIVCKKCGKVYDFFYSIKQQQVIDEIEKQLNVQSDMDNIVIEGICCDCKDKQ